MATVHKTIYIIVGEVGKEPFWETWIAGYHPDKASAESFAKTAGAYAQRMAREYIDKDLSLFDAPKAWLERFCKYDAQLVGLTGTSRALECNLGNSTPFDICRSLFFKHLRDWRFYVKREPF